MGENSPKLLDLMAQSDKECLGGDFGESCDEKKLELRLGLPYEENWQNKQGVIKRDPHISLSYFNGGGGGGIGCGKVQEVHPWNSSSVCVNNGKVELSVMEKNASQACYTGMVDLQKQKPEKKVFSPLSVKTAAHNTSQKRAAPAPVVGWPPIRSFRKNLASSSSAKTSSEPQNGIPSKPVNVKQPTEISNKGRFVKINMDGVAIGRKVDLNAYNCYENLSSVVDTLFRSLLAAQNYSSADGMEKTHDKQEPITGLLDGTGEYTLVYEDNEGDRMLVGDVPWHMFVSTVKRLRVLKSSDLPTLNRKSAQPVSQQNVCRLAGDVKGKAIVEGAS